MNLQITDAGLLALAAAAETHTVRLSRVAVGDGRGPGGQADAGRTALRTERDSAAAAAATPAAGPRLAVRAHVPTSADYAVSEVGVFGRPILAGGVPGDETLFAFWTDPATTLTRAVPGAVIAIAGLTDVRNAGAGAVAAALQADLLVAVPQAFTDLADTPAQHIAGNLLRIAPAGDAVDSVTVADAAAQILTAAPPRLRVWTAAATLTAPDYPCRWLVAAWGAGAGGPAQTPDPLRPPTDGGATRMLIGGSTTFADFVTHVRGGGAESDILVLQAAGGYADGTRAVWREYSLARDGESTFGRSLSFTRGQFRLRGSGAAGGRGYLGSGVGGAAARGNNGDLAISLFTPTPAQTYAITTGDVGQGGQAESENGHDGQPGRLAILELR